MSRNKEQKAESIRRKAVKGCGRRAFYRLLLIACCLLFFTACRQDMQDQPRYEAYEASKFFKDGLSSRPLVAGTVPRGYLRADTQLYTGKKTPGGGSATGGANTSAAGAGAQAGASGGNMFPDDVDTFPFPVTKEVVDRGQERYQIFCSMCHGATGAGDGMVVRRGFKQPPSYYTETLRNAPVGHFFDVMTNGWGSMPAYAQQIPVQDRWAIVAYIRALQLSHPVTEPDTRVEVQPLMQDRGPR